MSTPSLWRHADFLRLWTGQTISRLGSVVTRTALPLVALLVLGAGPREMAYLVISASAGVLLVGLVAGAWVDRLRRRPILVWTDIIRAALLFWVPVAYAIGALRIEQLYAVAFIEACLASLFNSAYPAYVPSLIGTDRVVDANSKLATSSSIAEIGGPGLAGTLVQIAGAPFAILVDAFSFVVSAVSLALIRSPEPLRPTRDTTTRIAHEIIEGLWAVRRHAVVYPLALRSILGHVFGSFYGVLYSLYLLQDLHLDPFLLGIVISAGGVGSLVGSVFASRVIRALGIGRAIIWMALGASAVGVLTPLAQGPVALATLMVFLPQLIGDGLQTIEGVGEISLVQGLIPDRILGRANATLEVVSHGIGYPIGALIAAVIAEQVGVRSAI
ncbi:MAG: MFS transporter, partial [Chloroflexota bacterium]|nr:MFS transporter [Chloroflexota bacterium]